MTITTRPASLADILALQTLFTEIDALHIAAHPERFRQPAGPARSEAYLREYIGNREIPFVVAQAGDELVGLVNGALYHASEMALLNPRRWLWIETLVVRFGWRGRGVGRVLMTAIEDWARARDVHDVELNVWTFNQGAIDFYEELGYRPITLRMWKSLDETARKAQEGTNESDHTRTHRPSV